MDIATCILIGFLVFSATMGLFVCESGNNSNIEIIFKSLVEIFKSRDNRLLEAEKIRLKILNP